MFYYEEYNMDIQRIIDWNQAVGNFPGEFDWKLEIEMLEEEFNETKMAISSNDKVEIVDWAIDMVFVAIGTLYKLWVNKETIEKCFTSVCDSNFSKLPFTKTVDGKVKKWPLFQRPNIEEILDEEGII